MKHVFIIASHTSFLSAIGTCHFLQLPSDDVLLLYMRNYENCIVKHPFHVLEVTNLMNMVPQLYKSRKLRKHTLQHIDEFVEQNIGMRFHLYCPHMSNSMWQAFYTNRHCIDVAYIQEGGIPFKKAYNKTPTLLEKIKFYLFNKVYLHSTRIWRGGWYFKGTLYKQNEIHSYAISDDFFKYLPSINHIIKWPTAHLDMKIKESSTIFVFDGFVGNNLIEYDFYMKQCARLVVECASEDDNQIKFHPAQSDKETAQIQSFFEKAGKSYEVMRNDIPLELIISSFPKLNIVGFSSSLLVFAHNYGHNVTSHEEWLLESRLYKKYKKTYY